MSERIENVSDTALWVAVYRAMETERPDAVFRDPYAARLAGERGRRIVEGLPQGRASAWPMIVRTCVFDELVLKCVRELGADCVVNLAAGLDTRPYRLELPESLLWIEADLPGMIDYKSAALAGEKPRCRLERRAVDLLSADARLAFLTKVCSQAKRALFVTEGLLIYLTPMQVAQLGDDLRAAPAARWWLTDWAHPRLLKMLEKRWGGALKELKAGGSEFKFAPENGPGFFTDRGWRLREDRLVADEARRIGREMPMAWLWRGLTILMPRAKRELYRRLSGYALLERPDL